MWLLAPHPLTVFGLHTHAVFFVIAAEVAALYLSWWLEKKGVSPEPVPGLVFCTFVGGLVAARLGYFISYPSQFINVKQVIEIWQGGLVSYWGMAMGALILWVWLKKKPKQEQLVWWDGIVLSGLLAWAIGRLGNYYAADSVGVLSTVWKAFYGRVPIQLFESGLCGLSFLWLRRQEKPGQIAWLGFIFYFAGRAVIDTWRFETVMGGLHVSQWVSVTVLLFLLIGYRNANL